MGVTQIASTVGSLARAAGDLLLRCDGDAGTSVRGLAYDSRAVADDDLFFCIPGIRSDGHLFAPDAVEAGAAALCVERPLGLGVPEIVVSDGRRTMGRMAADFFGHPSAELLLIGVTGTNGKTTTAWLLESVLRAAGHTTGLIGTVETHVAGRRRAGVRTTPESVDLHRLFAEMRAAGVGAVAMEVTSHGLALHRVEGLRFASAGFTNLSQDHLDFHSDMEHYFAAKRSLFRRGRTAAAAVNLDDPSGRRLWEMIDIPVLGFGTSPDAGVRARAIHETPAGTAITMSTPGGEVTVETALVGDFNVSNCLGASASALQAGIGLGAIVDGLAEAGSVPGRFEPVDRGQPFAVVVDYAHTPDSLDNVLREARRMARRRGGRVVCVFGCGGDRDRGKRPLMGAVAARRADIVVVTSDNPRSEDPEAIMAEIVEGVVAARPGGPDELTPDRREAIGRALSGARSGDVVVIAGKGHERGQELADGIVPFDDRVVAAETLLALGWESGR
jgi:UDP-N-acetylmuramoyl-L-alanyl-D-glutamate--2,6-diaminopimelate ligase